MYAVFDYENAVAREMVNADFAAIIIDDQNIAQSFGKQHYIKGKIRNSKDSVIDYDPSSPQHRNILQKSTYQSERIIQKNGNVIGKIEIYSTNQRIAKTLEEFVKASVIQTFTVCIFLSFILLFSISKLLTNPIRRLVEAARSIESGNYKIRANVDSKDEVGELASTFNSMTKQLKQTLDDLQKEIEERRQAEKALRENENFLDAIIENIPDMIFVKEAKELRFVRFNKAGEDLIGVSRKSMIGKNDYDFFPKEQADFFTKKDREVLKNGTRSEIIDEPIKTQNKGERILHTKKIPLLDDNGNPLYLLGISEDITDHRKLEEQLRQSQKMESIGNLAGGIAHDFNNILFPVIGMSELLLEDLPLGSVERENAEEIFKAGKRGSDLVKQILAFSRQSEHQMAPTRVQKVLKEVLNLARSTIPSDIEIKQDIQTDCGLIMADSTQIHQVAMNLVTNAYHAVETNGGKISICLKEESLQTSAFSMSNIAPGRYAILSISDTGNGIPPELLDKIFDPYFTTKEQGKGTGLGLAVVHGIVKEHNGEIKVNTEIGKGTTFNVYIPLMDKTDAHETVEQSAAHPVGNERILLVDDEESIAKLEKQMLERLGYQITIRNSSPDALKTLQCNLDSFDLVITDMTMPNMTGDKLARKMIALRPDLPIIICTGFSERINQEKAEAFGIKGFLMKPVIKSDLAEMVRKVLDESRKV